MDQHYKRLEQKIYNSLNQIVVTLDEKVPGLLHLAVTEQNQRADRHVKFLRVLEDCGIYRAILGKGKNLSFLTTVQPQECSGQKPQVLLLGKSLKYCR